MTNICVMVLGLPRSGTSAVAGALHHAGVTMEQEGMGSNELNPLGYYEDMAWKRLDEAVTGTMKEYSLNVPVEISEKQREDYRKLIQKRTGLWGVKDPRLCLIASHIWDLFDDLRIIAVWRNFDAVVRSLWSHSHIAYKGQRAQTKEEIVELLLIWRRHYKRTLSEWQGSLLEICYEDLLESPRLEVQNLCAFVSDNMGTDLDVEAGATFITPELNHQGYHPKVFGER